MLPSYALVLATVLLTVYGQIVIKWQVLGAGVWPDLFGERALFLAKLLLNPWIISALAAAFLASLTWMAAMTKLPISQGYPLTSLSFVLIMLAGHYIFGEALTPWKLSGIVFIIIGIVCVSKG